MALGQINPYLILIMSCNQEWHITRTFCFTKKATKSTKLHHSKCDNEMYDLDV